MAAKLKPSSIRRAQLYDHIFHRTRGSVTHLFIFKPSSFWDRWYSLCGRLDDRRGEELKDNHHLKLCVDCKNRLNEMNNLVAERVED